MKLEENFKRHRVIDIRKLREWVLSQSEADWSADSYRQDTFAPHKQTQTIPLLFDQDFRHFEPTATPKFMEVESLIRPIFQEVSANFGYQGWVIRCILVKLVAGGKIPQHVDFGFSLLHVNRLHIPILTNDKVSFTVGGETVHMGEGELWEIHNGRAHYVENHGDQPRIHLIIDWAYPPSQKDIVEYVLERAEHQQKVKMGITPKYD